MIESARDYAIFSMDLARNITTWNSGAERLFGYREDEVIGQPGDVVFTPEDQARGAPEGEARDALNRGRAEDERWHMRKNGQRFYASGVMVPLRQPGGGAIGLLKIARDLTERKLNEERLRASRDELEKQVDERTRELRAANAALRAEGERRTAGEAARLQLLQRLSTAQEEERLRISRELHDEVGQHLAALMLRLNALESALGCPGDKAALTEAQQLTETIGRRIHELAVQLRPTALDDLGLAGAVRAYAEVWSTRSGVPVHMHFATIEDQRLPPAIELALYRIVQEALTNVLKHAGATRVTIVINRVEAEVVAVIEDNGRGFDAEGAARQTRDGIGLLGMQERAAALQGRVTVEALPGHGTSVFVRLPLKS